MMNSHKITGMFPVDRNVGDGEAMFIHTYNNFLKIKQFLEVTHEHSGIVCLLCRCDGLKGIQYIAF